MLEVYNRPDSPYWWYKIPLLDDNGHVIRYERGSTKRRDKREAKLVAKAYAKKIQDRDQLDTRETSTIQQAGERYLAELIAEGKPSQKDARTFVARLSSGTASKQTFNSFECWFPVEPQTTAPYEGLCCAYH